jgi:hypothetical protein
MKKKQILRVLTGSLLALLIMITANACDTTNDTPKAGPAATVTSVAVTPSTADVDQGSTQQFTATVTGENSPSQGVTWTITGNIDAATSIDTEGLLTVNQDEPDGTVLTITATSTVDTTQSGTATVTVFYRSAVPVVRSVSVDPLKSHAQKGATIQFTVQVSVSGPVGQEPATTVNWAIGEAGKKAGTTISATGLLTIASDETLTALTITATSTELDHKVGTAVVNVIPIFTGQTWTDGQVPESTIVFNTNSQLTLAGNYWAQHNGPTSPSPIAGARSYELSNDWNGDAVEPAMWVVLDTTNRIGFEFYYYYPISGKPQRLVAYVNGLQPRVFYRTGEENTPFIPTPDSPITDLPNPAKNALIAYFNTIAIDIGVGANGNVTAASLTTGVTSVQPGVRTTGTLTYAAAAKAIIYRLTTDNPTTLDVYAFSQDEGDAIAAAIKANLGVLAGAHADITAGYKYFGDDVTAALTVFPAAGSVEVSIPLAQDTVADDAVATINAAGAIDTVNITGATAAITGTLSASASYTSASQTLQVTVPAAGISASGATAVARALSTAVTGKITTDDRGYAVPSSATGAISGTDVVASIKLAQAAVTAATITAAITPTTGALTISGGSATSDVITALNGIANATGTANATYDGTRHEVVITVTPAANLVFSTTTGAYNTVATAISQKFAGKVTTNVAPSYSTLNTVTSAVTGGNLVFTVVFSNYIDGATITAAINSVTASSSANIASASNITGDVLTALGSIASATSTVTPSYISANHTLVIRVAPATGFTFNPGLVAAGKSVGCPYAAVVTAIVAKLGATVTNAVDSTYSNVKSSVGIEVSGGNLVFTVQLATVLPANSLVTAIDGAANGDLAVTGVMNASFGTDWGVTGAVIDALGAPLTAPTSAYNETTGSITVTLVPGPEYVFSTVATDYASVSSALSAKPIGTIVTTDKKGNVTIREATGVTHALVGGNLVLTIATAETP